MGIIFNEILKEITDLAWELHDWQEKEEKPTPKDAADLEAIDSKGGM